MIIDTNKLAGPFMRQVKASVIRPGENLLPETRIHTYVIMDELRMGPRGRIRGGGDEVRGDGMTKFQDFPTFWSRVLSVIA